MDRNAGRDSGWDFHVLGPLELHDHASGSCVVPAGPKQRALLGALVSRAGEVLSADRLIDELWGERPPARAANALQAHVSRLRRLLPAGGTGPGGAPDITTHPLGYLLRPGSASTDAQRFQELSAQGRAAVVADPEHAAELLHRALALWRGPALQGCGRGRICAREAERLEQGRLAALETFHEARLRGARHAETVGELERLTAAHPTRERFHDLLMLALYRCGRRSEALGVYERARQRLMSEVGVEPGPALRARMESILHRDPDRDAAPAVPAPAPGPRPLPSVVEEGALLAPGSPEAGLPDLGAEIARLRARVEEVGRAQEELARRLGPLLGDTAGTTAGAP
ncbi:BTAD domain-containing putative transcriptional regulator [Streptomyces sp. NPDC012888]|uniref:AfsR/SARP family transcriptional regulator n=1 Tax=Streptomyces sp. NPDC012888 TaxID=3364855 RepID=UPI00369257F4